jgi:N,N'-diacetyllegionaminate synthase
MAENEIKLKGRTIGPGHPSYFIAEAGINHNGNLDMAMELVDVAADAGVDAVKFQTFNPDTVITKNAGKARYQKSDSEDTETFHGMLSRLALNYEDFRLLRDRAHEKGISFMSKGYKEDLNFLFDIGVPMFKIDSASIIYHSHISKAATFGIPIVLSTGTATLGEVEKALGLIRAGGDSDVILLHCTTAYPAPIDQMNLKAMATLRTAFDVNVGLSDHSEGYEAALAATAMGSVALEKHFTLDRNLTGPDHKASIEPDELVQLVKSVRKVEAALGSPVKGPTETERENMLVVRRSLVAERDIKKGEPFDESMVSFKRPAGGLGEEFKEIVLGRVATSDIPEGDPITWDIVGGFSNG